MTIKAWAVARQVCLAVGSLWWCARFGLFARLGRSSALLFAPREIFVRSSVQSPSVNDPGWLRVLCVKPRSVPGNRAAVVSPLLSLISQDISQTF